MSRRATSEELAAAEELAREVAREGGRSGLSLNELLEAFAVRRFRRSRHCMRWSAAIT